MPPQQGASSHNGLAVTAAQQDVFGIRAGDDAGFSKEVEQAVCSQHHSIHRPIDTVIQRKHMHTVAGC